MGDRQRQRHQEGAPLAVARALHPHRAAVQLDQVAHDGEPEAEPAVAARGGAVELAEAVEDVRQELGRDAGAVVGDDDLDVGVDPLEADLDLPRLGRELDGVREQVPHHLLQASGIARHRPGERIDHPAQLDLLGLGGRADRLDGGVDHRREVGRLHVEAHLAGDDAGDARAGIVDQL